MSAGDYIVIAGNESRGRCYVSGVRDKSAHGYVLALLELGISLANL